MNKTPRNPSAFPAGLAEGMTLRDYFAAKAMEVIWQGLGDMNRDDAIKFTAETAYSMADAMLAERERTE